MKLDSQVVAALADTGADVSLVADEQVYGRRLSRGTYKEIKSVQGSALVIRGSIMLPFEIGSRSGEFEFQVAERLEPKIILGRDFLAKVEASPDVAAGLLRFACGQSLPFLPEEGVPIVAATQEVIPEYDISTSLSARERAQVMEAISEGIYSSEEIPFGRVQGYTHEIDTGTAKPIYQALRRTSPAEREIVRREVEKMLAMGVIRPSKSPWASPVTLVKKKDGDIRFCVDMRKVNDVTVKDKFPLPRIDDMLAALSGCKYFTKLDAACGYWQVPMEESSIPKTAFICTEGLFEFLVMPFGLTNAPATYQRMMQDILSDLLWRTCMAFLDDNLVFGKTLEEHNARLKEVLARLRERGVRLKPKKCEFAKSEVAFLGFIVSGDGIKPDPKKIEKLVTYPVPQNVTQVRAFLGLGSYYRRFITGFATIAAPLHDLTTKEEWVWTDECQKAYETLKTAIVEGAVQQHPDFSKPFIVDTDASEIGMGVILSQVDPKGDERIVALDSRKFSKAESKWHIREKEALGIIWALEKFRPFILGTDFMVRTDHSSLKWLLEAKDGRLGRWALRLSEFTPFKIVHRSGVKHTNVDAFTRVFAESDTVPDHHVVGAVASMDPIFPTIKEWIEAQEADKSCQVLQEQGKTTTRDGLVGIGRRHTWRPILPRSLVSEVAKKYHESLLGSHLGARKLLSVLSRKVVIPGGATLVKQVIRGCLACAQRKPPKQRLGHMASRPPRYAWETVAMDFCGPYAMAASGKKYVLVFVDHFTKWIELVPTSDMLAITVVRAFYERVICHHGVPKRLLSDNGPQFRSALVEALCRYFGIEKVFSSAYYPQGDGYAERMMRTMNNSLSVLCRESPYKWDGYVPGLQFAYNSSAHEALGYSPFEMNTGRIPRLPGEVTTMSGGPSEWEHIRRLHNTINTIHQKARDSVDKYWNAMKARFDKGRKDIGLSPGSVVLVQLTDAQRCMYPNRKLAPRWTRPGKVIRTLKNGVTHEVALEGGSMTVHVSRLLPLEGESWGDAYPEPRARKTIVMQDKPDVQEEEDGDVHFENVGPTLTGMGEGKSPSLSEGPGASAVPEGGEMGLTPRMVSTPEPGLVPAVPGSVGGSPDSAATEKSPGPLAYKDGFPLYHVKKLHDAKFINRRKHFLVEWKGYPKVERYTWEPRIRLYADAKELVSEYETAEKARKKDTGRLPP